MITKFSIFSHVFLRKIEIVFIILNKFEFVIREIYRKFNTCFTIRIFHSINQHVYINKCTKKNEKKKIFMRAGKTIKNNCPTSSVETLIKRVHDVLDTPVSSYKHRG